LADYPWQSKYRAIKVQYFVVNISKSIFVNSSAEVYFNCSFSDSWFLRRGARQGEILSAYFFNIYIDDILVKISSYEIGCFLGINRINLEAHADDIVLLSPSIRGLQFLQDKINILFNDHILLVVNTGKTVGMIFS